MLQGASWCTAPENQQGKLENQPFFNRIYIYISWNHGCSRDMWVFQGKQTYTTTYQIYHLPDPDHSYHQQHDSKHPSYRLSSPNPIPQVTVKKGIKLLTTLVGYGFGKTTEVFQWSKNACRLEKVVYPTKRKVPSVQTEHVDVGI